MSDYNVFAILVPIDERGKARKAFASEYNTHQYRTAAGLPEDPTATLDRCARSPTPTYVASHEDQMSFDEVDRIILTLDHPPKDPASGWIFGANPEVSDVYLGSPSEGVSHKHCRIWVDDNRCIWLRDHSRHGTSVRLGETMFEERNNETWILQYPPSPYPQPWSHITIMIRRLSFKVYFPNHNLLKEEYMIKLTSLCTLHLDAFPALGGLDIVSQASTAIGSTATTPPSRQSRPLFFVLEVLSQNAQSKVTRVINIRDARVYVTKVFLSGYGQKRKRQHWKQSVCEQVNIMRSRPHQNIIPVIEFWQDPAPTLVMPFYELGTLHEYIHSIDIDARAASDILRQCLMALAVIHSVGAVHRDLKPANVLIATIEPALHLVIADFGLSCFETSGPIETYCGTLPYLAPEVGSTATGYGTPVDMWALGVMMLEVNRPAFLGTYVQHAALDDWFDEVLLELDEFAQDRDRWREERLMVGILQAEPEARFSAAECLDKGCENGMFRLVRPGIYVDAESTVVNSPALPAVEDAPQDPLRSGGGIKSLVSLDVESFSTLCSADNDDDPLQMQQTDKTKKARL